MLHGYKAKLVDVMTREGHKIAQACESQSEVLNQQVIMKIVDVQKKAEKVIAEGYGEICEEIN